MPTTQPPDAATATNLADAWACFDQGRLDDAIRITRHVIQEAPHSLPYAYAALGWFLLSSGAIAEAEALLVSAIGRHPEHAPLHWYLGLVHLQEHRTEQAGEALLTAVTFDPALDEAAVSLAWVLGDLGRLQEATHYARQALAIKVQPDRLAQLGWFLLAQAQWQEAEPWLAQALGLQPENTATRCHLATALQKLGRHDEALALLSEGPALASPDAPALLQQQVRILRDLHRADAAFEPAQQLLAQAPDDAASHTLAALVHMDLGDVQAAAGAAEKAVALGPQSAEAWQALAQVRLLQQRPDEAAAALHTVRDLDPKQAADVHRQLGWIHHAEHRLPAAIAAFTAAVEGNADDASAWYGLAQAQYATEAFDAALSSVNRAVLLRGEWLDAQVLQARIRLDQGPAARDTAINQLRQTLALHPTHTEVRSLLVTALQRLEQYAEALQTLDEGLALSPEAQDLLRLRIPLLLDLRRTDDAHAACRSLIRRQPAAGAHWHLLALVLQQQKKPGMALRALARARRLAPALPEVWQQTGWLALERGDLPTAREAATHVLALAPEATSSDILAALVRESCGDLQAAAEHAQQAIDRTPRSAAAWRALAQVRARQDRLDDAQAALQTALDLDPQHSSGAYRQLGWVCIADKRLDDAIAAFTAATRDDAGAEDPACWYGLAEALRSAEHFTEALHAIREALKLRREWPEAIYLRRRIVGEQINWRMKEYLLDFRPPRQPAAAAPVAHVEPQPAPSPGADYEYALCSFSTKSHLPILRTLAASARRHFSGAVYLLLIDSDDTTLLPPGTIPVRIGDVIDPAAWQDMVARYNILELCCTLKPFLMRYVARATGRPVIYLDADTYLLDSLSPALPADPGFSVFLTPHLLRPFDGGRSVEELGMLRVGVYNAGLVGAGTDGDALRFLDWWADRASHYAYDAPEHGVFTDQKWIDLAPSFFQNVQTSRDWGLNVGPWRIRSEHDFTEQGPSGQLHFCGAPVKLMHVSRFNPKQPDRLTNYLPNARTSDSALGRFLRRYAQEVLDNRLAGTA